MTIKDELQQLQDFQCDYRCVLSVYLNTNPADPEQLNGAWRIHLKNGLKRLGEYLSGASDEKEIKSFNALKEKVVSEIESHRNDLHKGVVLFASEEGDLWSVHYVQVPVKTSFHWEKQPVLEEFHYMNKAYPNSGVVLPSMDEVRILDTSMGVLKEELTYEYEAATKRWKQKDGPAQSSKKALSEEPIGTYDGRMKVNLESFYKDMGATVDRLRKERKWEEIHVSGEAELANAFAKTLQAKPASCLHKNLNKREPNAVFAEVFEK